MSVAIRTAVRIQDQDDAPTLGAGQDGYALTWNNASGAFEATALFTGGLLATGATTGATSQAQAFTNGIIGPSWKPSADSTTALQLQNAAGTSVLNVDTTNARVGIGTAAPRGKTDVSFGFDWGVPCLCFGADATAGLTSRTNNTNKVATIGVPQYENAQYPAAMILASNTQTENILSWGGGTSLLHAFTRQSFFTAAAINTATGVERMRITSTGLVGIGTTAPATLLHGLLTSAATNAVTNVVTIGHDTSGTAAAGFGAGLLFQLESSTTAAQDAAQIAASWTDATHATRASALTFSTLTAGGSLTERMRIDGGGNVGIGTSAPISPLHIEKASDDYYLTLKRGTVQFGFYLDTLSGQFGTRSNHPFYIYTNDQTRMAVLATGNVGIGDTAPAEKLDVTGNINTTGVVKVDDVQVLSNRVIDARCADVANSGDATTDGLIDALRDAMVAHGLIAAA